MKRGRPPKYTARMRFMVEVLHLHGLPASRVASVMRLYSVPMSEKAVESLIYQLPYRRKEMPAAVRQRFLDRLKANRLDRTHGQEGLPDQFYQARQS